MLSRLPLDGMSRNNYSQIATSDVYQDTKGDEDWCQLLARNVVVRSEGYYAVRATQERGYAYFFGALLWACQ